MTLTAYLEIKTDNDFIIYFDINGHTQKLPDLGFAVFVENYGFDKRAAVRSIKQQAWRFLQTAKVVESNPEKKELIEQMFHRAVMQIVTNRFDDKMLEHFECGNWSITLKIVEGNWVSK